MNGDLKGWGGKETSIAGETLLPTEPPMGSLGAGKHIREGSILCCQVLNGARGEQNGLRAQQLEPVSPEMTALPIAPQHRVGRHRVMGERFIGR